VEEIKMGNKKSTASSKSISDKKDPKLRNNLANVVKKKTLARFIGDGDADEVPELYSLVNNKDYLKGELVILTREALKKKNFADVEKLIREKIPAFLLNEGAGDDVSLAELLAYRKMTAQEKRRKRKKKQAFKVKLG
jgi:hypothetical protein